MIDNYGLALDTVGMTFAFTRSVLEPTILSFKVIDVEAVARDGQVKGYCVVTKQHLDCEIETQPEGERWW